MESTSYTFPVQTGGIPCQINQFFAKFARPPSDFDEIWHIMLEKKSVQIFSDVGQAVSEI